MRSYYFSRHARLGLLIMLFAISMCYSCASDQCTCNQPEPPRPRVAYVFQQAVHQCSGCDACWLLYWYFDCDADGSRYLGHFDPRDGQDEPDWLVRAREIAKCYFSTGYCPDRSWGYYTDPTLTPRQNEEAEEAALWLAGSLVAPQDLYEILGHDLALIRASWRDSVPQVDSISFHPYFLSNYLYVALYPDDYARFRRGEYHDWDSLNTLFGVTEVRPLRYDSVYLIFRGRYHTPHLAQVYKTIPSIWTAERVGGESGLCEASTIFAWRIE